MEEDTWASPGSHLLQEVYAAVIALRSPRSPRTEKPLASGTTTKEAGILYGKTLHFRDRGADVTGEVQTNIGDSHALWRRWPGSGAISDPGGFCFRVCSGGALMPRLAGTRPLLNLGLRTERKGRGGAARGGDGDISADPSHRPVRQLLLLPFTGEVHLQVKKRSHRPCRPARPR